MTDAEIDTLARDILTKIVRRLERMTDPRVISEVSEGDDGELFPIYEASSEDGYGSFIFTYMPLDAIRKIVLECDRLIDEFTVELTDQKTGRLLRSKLAAKQTPKSRDVALRTMAENATLNIVGMFGFRLRDALKDAVDDGLIMAKVLLLAVAAQYLQSKGINDEPADVRPYIEEAVKRVADRKREELTGHIHGLPNLLAKRGQGALPKTNLQKKRERDSYVAKVKEAYKLVREREGKKPSKGSVAAELRVGGINPKKGSDTRLNAFGNNLRSLQIN